MATSYEQSAVSKVVWPWTTATNESKKQGKSAFSKAKPALQGAVVTAIGLLMLFRFHRPLGASVLFLTAAYVVLTGYLYPPGYAAFERFVARFAQGFGVALTWVLLVPFYYIFFATGRFFMQMRGVDPMQREFPTKAPTYWADRKAAAHENHYSKQYR